MVAHAQPENRHGAIIDVLNKFLFAFRKVVNILVARADTITQKDSRVFVYFTRSVFEN